MSIHRAVGLCSHFVTAVAVGACDYSGAHRVQVTNADPTLVAAELAKLLQNERTVCGDGRSREPVPKTAADFLRLGTVSCHDWPSDTDISTRFHTEGAEITFSVVAGPGPGLFSKAPDEQYALDLQAALTRVLPADNVRVSQFDVFAEPSQSPTQR